MRKELLSLFGDRVSRFMIVAPPIVQLVTFGWAATLEVKNVDLGILRQDRGLWSNEVIRQIQGSPTFRSIRMLRDEGELKKAVTSQEILLALVFRDDFSRRVEAQKPAQIQAIMDGRRSNASQIAANYIGQIVAKISATTPLANAGGGPQPLALSLRNWFNPNLEFQWFFIPNLIGMISLMLGLIVTGLSVAREREMGTFDQLLVSPATPLEIAIGKLAPGCVICAIQGSIFLFLAIYGFGVPFFGSFALFYVSLVIFSIASSSMGLMISSLAQTQQQAFLGAFTVGVPCILISGAVTPLMNMPKALQYLSQVNPLRHFTVIAQGLFLKDITLASALWNLGRIAIISIVAAGIAIWMFRRKV